MQQGPGDPRIRSRAPHGSPEDPPPGGAESPLTGPLVVLLGGPPGQERPEPASQHQVSPILNPLQCHQGPLIAWARRPVWGPPARVPCSSGLSCSTGASHGGPSRRLPAPASEDRRLHDPLSPGCRSHRRRRLEEGVAPRRPSDPVPGFRPTPLGPLGRRQIRVSDEGTGSISGPDPRPSSLQLPRAEPPTRPASGVWHSPPRLRPHQDEVRPLTAGAPPHSASELLGPTPSGGDLCNPSGLCFNLVRSPTGPCPVTADPGHLTALGQDRLRAYFGDGILPVLWVSFQQHQQTLRGSFSLSLWVWTGLTL
ncbi:hypothetical protein NDU88_000460 [Pleurodeles waltl]|uniref:Uncharacterized protein n=1 Tax=Pleurodeles waltl TaxID=8319 RepID=A0AAV7NAF7_PLEWA|nr:hypothetical protein NDU88_000460 [Pleurodeles waltl]